MMDMPKKKKNTSRAGWKIALALAIVVIGVGAVYFALVRAGNALADMGTGVEASGDEARLKIESVLGTKLPASATDMNFYGVVWIDYSYWMKFSLPARDFDALLKSAGKLCFTLPLQAGDDSTLPSAADGRSWWTPEKAVNPLSGSCGDNPYYNIRVDTANPETWTVYLNVFSA